MSFELDWNNLTPEQRLMPKDALERMEQESRERDDLLDRARNSRLTSLTVKSFQGLAWPTGGAIGFFLAGRLTTLGISALSSGIENSTGIPLNQLSINIPPDFLTSLHQTTDELINNAGFGSNNLIDVVLNGAGEALNQVYSNVEHTMLVFTSGTTMALYGFNMFGRFSASRAGDFGSKLGTTTYLQGIKLLSHLPISRFK